MSTKEEKELEKKILKELEPIIQKLEGLYAEIDNMVEAGLLTREQADDIMGATLDKDEEEREKQL